jgi:hypothetical protein
MYQEYCEDEERWGLRNPYATLDPLPPRRGRSPVRLVGLVGAGLSVVIPMAGRDAALPAPQVAVETTDADATVTAVVGTTDASLGLAASRFADDPAAGASDRWRPL